MVLVGKAFGKYQVEPSWVGLVPYKKSTRERPLEPSATREHGKKVPAMNQEEGPHMTMLAPWSWTYSFRNCEN